MTQMLTRWDGVNWVCMVYAGFVWCKVAVSNHQLLSRMPLDFYLAQSQR
jgi:hypothetical protein